MNDTVVPRAGNQNRWIPLILIVAAVLMSGIQRFWFRQNVKPEKFFLVDSLMSVRPARLENSASRWRPALIRAVLTLQ